MVTVDVIVISIKIDKYRVVVQPIAVNRCPVVTRCGHARKAATVDYSS